MTGLTLDGVSVRYGATTAVDAMTLQTPARGVLALLGPSGCGKSTLLRAIAGLEPLSGGRLSFAGQVLDEVPTYRRRFGLMFQDSVLFPHRSVAGNVAYGLEVSGLAKAAQRERVGELLELVGLAGYENRAIGTLSGGQAQRVALARALAPQPRLLLLDEPLAALDAGLRGQLLTDLRRIIDLTGTPTIFVTHDQDEAYTIADRVALMNGGRLVQQGVPQRVWANPADEWAARFLGYRAVLDVDAVPELAAAVPGSGRIAMRSSALVADDAGTITVIVHAIEPGPDRSELTVRTSSGVLLPALASRGQLVAVGDTIRLRLQAAGIAVLPGNPPPLRPAAASTASDVERAAVGAGGGILDG